MEFYWRRTPRSWRRRPFTYASKWKSLSLSSSSCRCLLKAHFLAASLAAGAMWLRRVKRQRDWAKMIDTEILLLMWWRRRPCSETDNGRPSSKEMCLALTEASFLSRSWKSWDISPYCPATRRRISPNPSKRCSRGPTCPVAVLWYLASIFLALFL